jgi:hypothetical protein
MHSHRFLTLAVSTLAVSGFTLTACNPFHRKPAVEVSTSDAQVNSRWHASLVTPTELAGAVQMNGSASMAPGSNSGQTTVSLKLANAAPGGVHPWAVHRGQCGADQGVFGSSEAYKPIEIGNKGRASASATIPLETPETGAYFVSVQASAANGQTIVACGNLAPPTE